MGFYEFIDGLPPVRDDYVPKEHYSEEFARLEAEYIWPATWQMACREEDLPGPGSYITYDILGDSIVVLRDKASDIRAFHNVCPHRGNRLVNGAGRLTKLHCSFHGWEWDTSGENIFLKDPEDWEGCPGMLDGGMDLQSVHVGAWGGFIYVNMSAEPEPFSKFIDPVPTYLDCLEFQKMRTKWHKQISLPANWKVALEPFLESYHIYTTHHQTVGFLDEASVSTTHGRHGKHGYPNAALLGTPSPRTGKPSPKDFRQNYVTAIQELAKQTGGEVDRVGSASGRSADAVGRILTELPAEASLIDIHMAGLRFMREAAEAEGAGWPEFTDEQAAGLGVDWNIFPNMVLVFSLDSTLVFRSRPDGMRNDRCIFDMWGLIRCDPANPPVPTSEYFADWRDNIDKIPSLLVQDLRNIEKVQAGMASRSFAGSRISPVQERQIFNLHKNLREYIGQ